MSIDNVLWTTNILEDLRGLSDEMYQAKSFSGQLKNSDTHPGEMIATIGNDDQLRLFVEQLPQGAFRESGAELIEAIDRLRKAVDFDWPWEQIVSTMEWKKVMVCSAEMLRLGTVDPDPGDAGARTACSPR